MGPRILSQPVPAPSSSQITFWGEACRKRLPVTPALIGDETGASWLPRVTANGCRDGCAKAWLAPPPGIDGEPSSDQGHRARHRHGHSGCPALLHRAPPENGAAAYLPPIRAATKAAFATRCAHELTILGASRRAQVTRETLRAKRDKAQVNGAGYVQFLISPRTHGTVAKRGAQKKRLWKP